MHAMLVGQLPIVVFDHMQRHVDIFNVVGKCTGGLHNFLGILPISLPQRAVVCIQQCATLPNRVL